ncbi:lipid-A-disaccharide synthase [Paracoccus sp. (in: a-proteobacteria)]|uniref:lipid-A-disaccharide synthase n=1 Tax=Paracoccus sp. TaxID=267 RepID=UPI0026DEDD78|nr:lipid-A-disaccharide synthase [Paracoccus sp. (in: a-proteobacteria)]MDO5647406.1 lipid-A-disaccharide synthase [Paracoccus sp. (in: a-proteobacteria)]
MTFFLIAGEPSGDQLGAALMAGLRELDPDVQFDGIGGPAMAGQGLVSRFPMQELTLMGIAEVLPKYFHLKRRIAETARAVADAAPDALITIDSPDFCLRVAHAARALRPDLRVVHYVAPSVWAWRAGRAEKMARVVDHVLAILPFEPPLMRAAGMSCDFVGHPIATAPVASPEQAAAFRAAHSIAPDQPLALCLPGSRRSEVARLGPRFGAALAQVPGLQVVVPTVPNVADQVAELTRDWPSAPVIVQDADDKRAAFAAADVALAASGTVSLDLAANNVPMVIGYDMAPLSRWLIGMLLRVDTVTLVNLVSDSRAVPEYLGRACQPDALAAALRRALHDPVARQAQMDAMALTMKLLGRGGDAPGLRAARSVMGAITELR